MWVSCRRWDVIEKAFVVGFTALGVTSCQQVSTDRRDANYSAKDTTSVAKPQPRDWQPEGDGIHVTQLGFKARGLTWPFTVAEGTLGCDRKALWFSTNGEFYSLNGWAVSLLGYQQAYAIWKFDEEWQRAAKAAGVTSDTRVNIGDAQSEARKLCGTS
jgi:hypothetical protein